MAEAITLYGMVRIDGAEAGRRHLRDVRAGFDESGHAAEKAAQRWHAAGRVLSGVVDSGKRLLGALGVGALAGGTALAIGAVKASTGYEELQARMEAVTGSAETMARKLEFVQRVANPSNFTFKQLADATVTLEAFGVNAERALPTVARLGMAFGAGDEQLQMLVRGLGDLSGGKFPEVDVLSAFGLNRQMFKDQGIEFDAKDQLVSSAVEVFDALERIVNERYGNIFDKMASTGSAKLASLQDTWERFQRVLGDGIMRVLAPSIEMLTRVLGAITDSGVLADSINAFADGFLRLFDASQHGDGIVRFVAGVASVISQIPDMIDKTRGAIAHFFDVVTHNTEAIMMRIEVRFSKMVGQLTLLLAGMSKAMGYASVGQFPSAALIMNDTSKHLRGFNAVANAADSMVPDLKQMDMQRFAIHPLDKQDEWAKRISAFMKPVDNSVPEARGDWLSRMVDSQEEADENLKGIRDNTHKAATELGNMRRQVLGGGDRAQVGATPAELLGGGGAYGAKRRLGDFGSVPVEVMLRWSTPDAQRFVRLESSRANGRGFNPR